jgi:hypothetical protein
MRGRYRRKDPYVKFLQSVDVKVYRELGRQAKHRGITLQELIRAVVIHHWLASEKKKQALHVR